MEYLQVSLPGESEYFPDRYSCEDDGIGIFAFTQRSISVWTPTTPTRIILRNCLTSISTPSKRKSRRAP